MNNVIRFGNDFIELVFNANWHYVQALWDFIKRLLSIFLRDNARSDIITMAIIEIVENAVKYSIKDANNLTEIYFRLNMNREMKMITVDVMNPADYTHYQVLKSELDRINAATDKKALFRDKMREAALRTDGLSQLGLVRIIVEAKADFKVRDENGKIVVSATFNLNEEKS